MRGYSGCLAVRLWDKSFAAGSEQARCTLHIRSASVLKTLISGRDIIALVEDYLAGRIELEGDLESLFDASLHFEKLSLRPAEKLHLLQLALQLPGSLLHLSLSGSRSANNRSAISRHYDVGNAFYHLWLDPEMVYSCAYFADDDQSLACAQQDKLDYLCRKLQLEPGQLLLDIGCGWGGLACWAARHYGVSVHGITLSMQQWHFANEKIRWEGLSDRVKIELRDYRELEGEACYDRVVSVGMFEHIGVANFPTYFSRIRQLLRPGGVFVNHGITNDKRWEKSPTTRFINHYIFPDGELTRISDVLDAMEQARFEVVDVEGLRRHYAMTLRHWVKALELRAAKAKDSVGEATYRLWRLYMSGCAHYFDEGSLGIYQVVGVRQQDRHYHQPLRRDYLYHPQKALDARE
ncbi:SAM-dependent methyltransferase [Sedimenticola selenatireducens]|uniref:SAM-dependent methyltransferase n=1 Tax=Sedimenticola selenatireducens TaxID=191960 RepID=UPI00146FA0A7|nr:cyclopropane-fatty-acyl-phospholipid synthase family protein [Sedimenticola selenatireducens]